MLQSHVDSTVVVKDGRSVKPLPPPKAKAPPGTRTISVVLPTALWDRLQGIADRSNVDGGPGYTRNGVVRHLLEVAVSEYEELERQQASAPARKPKK